MYLMGQTKSTEVSPFRIIRMKLTKNGRTKYILLNKKNAHNQIKFA